MKFNFAHQSISRREARVGVDTLHDEALGFVPRIKDKGQHTADNGVV